MTATPGSSVVELSVIEYGEGEEEARAHPLIETTLDDLADAPHHTLCPHAPSPPAVAARAARLVVPDSPPGEVDPALAGANFDNQASVTWAGGAGDSNVANVAVIPEPEFRFEKTADQYNAAAGDRLYFSIAYENTGTAAATGAQIVDYLPATMTPVAGSYGSAAYSTTDNTLTWSLGRVEPGEAGSVSYAVTVDTNARPGEAVNIATLTATNLPSPVQGSEETTINVSGIVELVVHKALADPDEDHVDFVETSQQ